MTTRLTPCRTPRQSSPRTQNATEHRALVRHGAETVTVERRNSCIEVEKALQPVLSPAPSLPYLPKQSIGPCCSLTSLALLSTWCEKTKRDLVASRQGRFDWHHQREPPLRQTYLRLLPSSFLFVGQTPLGRVP